MKITILTLFPEMFTGFLTESIIGRAVRSGSLKIEIENLRNFGHGTRRQVDDTPYGGGAGMVLKADVVVPAIKKIKEGDPLAKVILLTPQGRRLEQKLVRELASEEGLILVCGHYEGFDERIRDYVDEEISIGDYVLTGGELGAAVIIDAVSRLIPGVLGKDESVQVESFEGGLLEFPQYTRPEEFEGKKVPEVLLSGNHAKIEKWRKDESLKKTKKRRPDLLK